MEVKEKMISNILVYFIRMGNCIGWFFPYKDTKYAQSVEFDGKDTDVYYKFLENNCEDFINTMESKIKNEENGN